jgi:O-succinylbenzoic acid--CoA ligase
MARPPELFRQVARGEPVPGTVRPERLAGGLAPDHGDGSLTAVCLPPAEAAEAVRQAWEGGRAVVVVDPWAPLPERRRVLDAVRPTHLHGESGRRPVDGGEPVAPEVAAVVATSGTAGEPKAVELTWAGLDASAGAVSAALGAGAGDRWLCCLPLSGVGGLSVVARSFVSGVPFSVAPRFDAEAVAAAPATLVSLVPTQLARTIAAGVDLAGFRRVLVGGAPVPEELRRRAEDGGTRVTPTYGLSETWGGVVHDGRPLSGVEVRLGEADEILLRGAVVMRGYRGRPDLTRQVLDADGWLRTADVGAWADDGRLRVVDRRDDLVITGGVNVSPTEVEAVLAAHPGVADVGVTGAPDPEWGQRVVAYVVASDPASPPTLAGLRAYAAERLSAPKLPRQVVLLESIPRTPGGKIRRRLLRV